MKNKVRAVLLLVVILLLGLTASYCEEDKEQYPVFQAYLALADEPTPVEEDEFVRLLENNVSLQIDMLESKPHYSGFANILESLSIRGFEDAFISRSINGTASEDERERGKHFVEVPRKAFFLRLAVFKTALRLLLKLPPDKAKSAVYYVMDQILTNIHTHIEFGFYSAKHYQYILRKTREIEEETKVFAARDERIEREFAAINLGDEDKWNALKRWKAEMNEPGTSIERLSALVLWIWRNFKLDDVLKNSEVESYDICNKDSLKTFYERYIDNRLHPEQNEWRKQGWLHHRKAKNSSMAIASLIMRLIWQRLIASEYAIKKKRALSSTNIARVCSLNLKSFDYALHSEVYDSITAITRYWAKRKAEETKRIIKGYSFRLQIEEEGEGGEAWFIGDVRHSGKGSHISLQRDFLYPFVFIVASDFGEIPLMSYFKTESFLPSLLGQTEWYTWLNQYYTFDEEGTKDKFFEFGGISFEYNYTKDGVIGMFKNKWKERYFKGLSGVNPRAFTPASMLEEFIPATFYHFKKTRWKLYNFCNYSAKTDTITGKRQFVVLTVYPDTETQCDEVNSGFLYKELDDWRVKAGFPRRFGRTPWNCFEFKNDKGSKNLFNKAKALAEKNDRDYKKNAAKGLAEHRRKAAEMWGIKEK